MKVFSILPLVVAASLGMNLKEPVVNEVMDMVESGLGETKEGRALFITLTLTESTWSGSSSISGRKLIFYISKVGCLNGDHGSDHSVQLCLCVCL